MTYHSNITLCTVHQLQHNIVKYTNVNCKTIHINLIAISQVQFHQFIQIFRVILPPYHTRWLSYRFHQDTISASLLPFTNESPNTSRRDQFSSSSCSRNLCLFEWRSTAFLSPASSVLRLLRLRGPDTPLNVMFDSSCESMKAAVHM